MEFIEKYLDFFVIGLLLAMSLSMLACVIERYLFLSHLNLSDYKTENEITIATTKNMGVICSVASNAPYVGLLGTVFGILITFYSMGNAGSIDAGKIMIGLALALKATALGLLVAIPATMFYTALLRKIEVTIARWQDASRTAASSAPGTSPAKLS